MCREGIPNSVRSRVWLKLAGIDTYKRDGMYEELLSRPALPIYEVIEKDISRCYPDHIQFYNSEEKGQKDLFNVLKAYAQYNPDVGYCQGMGRLVGMMLMHIQAEETFWLLVATIDRYLPGYFNSNLMQLRVDIAAFDMLLMEKSKKLAKHLIQNQVHSLIYATQWFMTLFTMVLPWECVLRMWDIFYLEGKKVMFKVGLAIMECIEGTLLTECPSTNELLVLLTHVPHDLLESEKFMRVLDLQKLKRVRIEKAVEKVVKGKLYETA